MTEEEYKAALKYAENLMSVDPTPDSRYGKRLDEVVTLIEVYEREHYPLKPIERHLRRARFLRPVVSRPSTE